MRDFESITTDLKQSGTLESRYACKWVGKDAFRDYGASDDLSEMIVMANVSQYVIP